MQHTHRPPFFFILRKVFLILFLFISSAACPQKNHSLPEKTKAMLVLLNRFHYQPVQFNAVAQEEVFWSFMYTLDKKGIYFTRQDLQQLSAYKNTVVDEMQKNNSEFFHLTLKLYKKSLLRSDSLIKIILAKPLDFTKADSMFYHANDTTTYVPNTAALHKRWQKWIKYNYLEEIYAKADNENPYVSDFKTLSSHDEEIRKRLIKKLSARGNKILNHGEGYENYIASLLLSSLAHRYDPHTEYFSPFEKEKFEESVSSEELSFGIFFDDNEEGEIFITELIPGGPAWKSNMINEGDILISVKPLDVSSKELQFSETGELDDFLKETTAIKIEFTIRKNNGQIKSIALAKEKIQSEDNQVKSYILQGEKKIGFISLPSFYTEWENSSQLGCANDVAKEIIKLKEEKIEGLILDVRYNGGGSLKEALDLAGIFIDEGALGIHKSREGKPYLMKDLNRGTIYDGPLILMVNGLSASASEVLACAFQDYHRAVIVGAATYGKATGQNIYPLDTAYHSMADFLKAKTEWGYVKITTDKLYRVTNKTHQRKGVKPDVNLPDPLHYAIYKESSNPFAFDNDSVVKKVVFIPYAALPLHELQQKSEQRLSADKGFTYLNFVNDSMETLKKQVVILQPDPFSKTEEKIYFSVKKLEKMLTVESEAFLAMNNLYTSQLLEINAYAKELNEAVLKNLQHDIYINETYHVMIDLINLINK